MEVGSAVDGVAPVPECPTITRQPGCGKDHHPQPSCAARKPLLSLPETHGGHSSVGVRAVGRSGSFTKIPWGTPVKEEEGQVLVMYEGHWLFLSKLTGVTKEELLDYHESLYKTRKVPSTWVFNDFGHATCFLYRDKNRNRRVDRSEIHTEFIHTTAENEAQAALSQPVVLDQSHGCIHVRPADIDRMVKRGFLRKNTPVIVHNYSDRKVIFPRAGAARPPYEIHFFPGMKKLLVVGNSR